MNRILPVAAAAAALILIATSTVSARPKAKRKAPAKKPAATAATPADVKKPCKRLIGGIRYSKNAMALKQLDSDAQTRMLLAAHYDKATPADSAEFGRLFAQMFAAIAFPRVRKNFEKLETILYDRPKISGDTAKMGSTIVILHPMKKQEIRATFDLKKSADGWKVVDVQVKGDKSMLTNVRDDQVQPIIKKGGMKRLLELMRKRVAKIKT